MGTSRGLRARLLLVLALVVGAVVPLATARAATAAGPPRFADGHGIHVLAVHAFDDRDYGVRVLSPALARPVDVRILLPSGYAGQPDRRYPVLYLFHGTSGRASDWVRMGHAEATTAGRALITVMPDAGFDGDGGGWFTDWYDTSTPLGPSKWETFHVRQLIPWIDQDLRTIAARGGRAIAGLSQGGFGSMSYAARHPDLFVSVASFSGAPDIDHNPLVAVGATAVIEGTAVGLDHVEPFAMFGPRATNEANWAGHDPSDLAPNLRGMGIWLYTATGIPGPLDPPKPDLGAMGIETLTHASTLSFHQHTEQLGIPTHLDDYVFGTHSFPYWARDLRQYVVPLMRTFAHPPPAPRTVSYRSVDRNWSQWGWSVSLRRSAALQFSSLEHAGRHGFALRGHGLATVLTPPFYDPGSVAAVTLTGPGGPRTVPVQADGAGRLHLRVPLGGPLVAGTAAVTIRGVGAAG